MAHLFQKVKVFCLLSPAVTSLILGHAAFAAEPTKKATEKPTQAPKKVKKEGGYTINFTNIPIVELLKFVGRIGNVNFIYEEPLLDFNVTINSQDPASLEDILSALVQILRIHGFELIEQGPNLIVHQNPAVNQIASVISDETPLVGPQSPVVTRVFRIENTTPTQLIPLFKPMMSTMAIIEAFDQTRQLIVTDNSANVDKMALLLQSLDAPHLALSIDAYTAKENSPHGLIEIAHQIMVPLAEGNPVIMVPQPETGTIFIISTPYLIERTIAVLEDLDNPTLFKELQPENILLFRLKYQTPEVMEAALLQLDQDFEAQGYANVGIVRAISGMRYIKEAHALLFTGPADVLSRLQTLLDAVDINSKPLAGAMNATFFIYQPKYEKLGDLSKTLQEIGTNLASARLADPELLYTINNVEVLHRINALLFTGDEKTIAQIQEMLGMLDAATEEEKLLANMGPTSEFLIYHPKVRTGDELVKSVRQLASNLEHSHLADPGLLQALGSGKFDTKTNTVLFTGTKEALSRLQGILDNLDAFVTGLGKAELYLYRVQFVNYATLEEGLKNLAATLPENDPIAITIDTMKWLPNAHSLAFRGPPEAIDRIKEILSLIDSAKIASREDEDQKTYAVYRLQNVSGATIQKDFTHLLKNLKSSGIEDDGLISAIKSIEWIQTTNSLYISGSPSSLDKIKALIQQFDVPRTDVQEATKFYIYKPRYRQPKDIKDTLLEIAENLQQSNLADPTLLTTIANVRFEKSSNSLIFTGTPESIGKIQELLPEVDSPDMKAIKTLGAATFLIYQPQSIPADQLMQSLRAVANQINASDIQDKEVVDVIGSMRYVKETNTIIFTGPSDVLERIEAMIAKFDSSAFSPIQKVGKTTFFVYQPKYVSVVQLTASLKAVATDLQRGADPDEHLIATIDNMRFSADSKNIVFTGPTETLQKVQDLIEKFDNPSLADIAGRIGPGTYLLYSPKNQHGDLLIDTMRDFEKNLMTSGLQQSALYDVINNLKWMEKTCTILISGESDAVQEVEQLLSRFDVPLEGDKPETSIETFDDVSFLIYKLQYHRGDAIEGALKKIAEDLKGNSATKVTQPSENSENLIDAINSVQWIEITNSLIGTGKPQTLVKLKELLKSLDIPLRQVFIELLVIETDLSNNLDLGLRWGSQGKIQNKLAFGTGSFPSFGNGTDPAVSFNQSLSNITATNTPKGQNIPFVSGFDLGVIGDLIFHKGQSYASLGTFLNAAKEDGDITIVLDQKLITQDGKNSTLFVGDNIPFIGSTVNNVSQSTIQTSNIEYRDIGVSLSITPTLGDDDVVTLDIDEEITEQLTSPSSSSLNNSTVIATGISTSKTTTTTSVAVPDRHFLVLSGMMRNQTAHDIQSIPCLGGIPILGLAFQNKTTTIEKKNVIIFIKPHIIHSFDEYKKITTHQEEQHRAQSSVEEYDAGIDLVKTPEDEY